MINVGIDVHKKRCVTAVQDGSGRTLERITFENSKDGITAFACRLRTAYKGEEIRAVCESTANYWIRVHDILEEHGIDTALVHPAKVKIIAHARIKDDRVDAGVLADLLRAGMLPESFVPDRHYRDLRLLVRTRIGKVQEMTRCKNRIHSILAKYDFDLPTKSAFTASAMDSMVKMQDMSDIDSDAVRMYLDDMDRIRDQVRKLEGRIASIADADSRARLLMTVPGISYITAVSIISEVVDVARFATAEKLVSYAGLVPSRRDSADRHRGGSITKQGSTWLRRAVGNAATVAIRHDPRMRSIYDRVRKRRGWQKAKVAAARHLAEISWHILSTGKEYRTQNAELTQRKYKRMQHIATSA